MIWRRAKGSRMNKDLNEHDRLGDLTDRDIMEHLGRRYCKQQSVENMQTLKRIILISAHNQPALAAGLRVAAGLCDLFSEAVLPDGRLTKLYAKKIAVAILNPNVAQP